MSEEIIRIETVVLPISNKCVLLGKNKPDKIRFPNLWNGFGGGKNPDESIESCAVRELAEEIGLIAQESNLVKVAEILFHFGGIPKFQVHFFTLEIWTGAEKPSGEFVELQWFPFRNIPINDMAPGDKSFISRILSDNEKVRGSIFFTSDGEKLVFASLEKVNFF